MRRWAWVGVVSAIGCGDGGGRGEDTGPVLTTLTSPGGSGDDGGSDDDSGGSADTAGEGGSMTAAASDWKWDVGGFDSAGMMDDGCGTECVCTIPDHVACDAGTTNPFVAIGLNCPAELQVVASTSGNPLAIGVRSSFGSTATFNPTEGSTYAVIGSGLVNDLNNTTPGGDSNSFPTHCSDDLGAFDPGGTLPAPLRTNDVGAQDCSQNAALIGTGDCSNTINGQFSQGGSANDYTELRFELDVPPDVVSFSYDFAFFSVEYPDYFGSQFNDMYVGWLESELWTGNISFDAAGNPISLNAGFLEFKDDGGNLPEFAGTCMRQHAGTNWLQTTAGVAPGEHITVVFAIFDLSDSILDSYAFLDNWQWGCDPTGAPVTQPEG